MADQLIGTMSQILQGCQAPRGPNLISMVIITMEVVPHRGGQQQHLTVVFAALGVCPVDDTAPKIAVSQMQSCLPSC
jgi:hypothetical protein